MNAPGASHKSIDTPCDSAPRELFIVEGKAAQQALQQVVNKRYQSVFALQGKPPNALKNSTDKLLANQQVQALIQQLNCGYAANCNLDELVFSKILLTFDGDVDGQHCAYLVVNLFNRLFHDLLLAEKVVMLSCPLYAYQELDKEIIYFNNELEKRRFLEKVGTGYAGTITRFKGLASLNRTAIAELLTTSARLEKLVTPFQITQKQE